MFRELELTHNGVEYRVKPTMDLIRRLELRDLSPFKMSSLIASKSFAFGTFCEFVAEVIQYAGGNVTGEQLYAELSGSGKMGEIATLTGTMVAVMLPPAPVAIDNPGGGASDPKTKARRSGIGSRRQRSS